MNFLDTFITTIRSWLAIDPEIYDDAVVTNWIRMAEEYLSEVLRCKEMIQIDWIKMVDGRVELPSDWLELDTVRFYPHGKPLIYAPRDEFYVPQYSIKGRYTVVGNYLLLGAVDTVAGTDVEISYYEKIPPLTNELENWPYKKNQRLLTLCTLWHAGMYAIEDDRTPMWEKTVTEFVDSMNGHHRTSRASGSILVAKRRSFG